MAINAFLVLTFPRKTFGYSTYFQGGGNAYIYTIENFHFYCLLCQLRR